MATENHSIQISVEELIAQQSRLFTVDNLLNSLHQLRLSTELSPVARSAFKVLLDATLANTAEVLDWVEAHQVRHQQEATND